MKNKVVATILASFLFLLAGTAALAKSSCADLCHQCSKSCFKMADYFKKQGGKYTQNNNVKLLEECGTACQNNANAMHLHAMNQKELDDACMELCAKCATMCKTFDDPKVKDCIALCEQCSSSCGAHKK